MVKSRILYTIFLLLFSVAALAQENKGVTDRDYYEFYNTVPQPYKLRHFVLVSEPERFDTFNNLIDTKGKLFDTIFAKSDSTFLNGQIAMAAHFYWGPGMIDGSTVVNKADIDALFRSGGDGWSSFNKMYKVDSYCQYSVPLFSSDRTICIVLCSEYCGSLCGEGDVYYYKKINGKWQVVYHYVRWVS